MIYDIKSPLFASYLTRSNTHMSQTKSIDNKITNESYAKGTKVYGGSA